MAARQDEPGLIWERPEPPSRPALPPLSRDRIVGTAIELADADGLDAVSLRKVAAALDAGPMRLYGYLSSKEELLDLMVDAVHGEIELPGPSGQDWRADLQALARRTRRAALRHEWFADLFGGRPHLGPNALAWLEAVLAAVSRVLDDVDAVQRAAGAVHAYLVGAIRTEVAESRTERATGLDQERWQAAFGPYLTRMLATGRYPTLDRAVREAGHPDPEAAFEAGLGLLLDGVA